MSQLMGKQLFFAGRHVTNKRCQKQMSAIFADICFWEKNRASQNGWLYFWQLKGIFLWLRPGSLLESQDSIKPSG